MSATSVTVSVKFDSMVNNYYGMLYHTKHYDIFLRKRKQQNLIYISKYKIAHVHFDVGLNDIDAADSNGVLELRTGARGEWRRLLEKAPLTR